MRELNFNKATTFGNIPTKILKQSSESCSDTLQKLFNDVLTDGYVPDKLKCADVKRKIYNKLCGNSGNTQKTNLLQFFAAVHWNTPGIFT